MSKTIPQLRSMWNRGADSYRTQEVGSGVQGFVKDILECPDIFNLKEGVLSTPREQRKNEFIYEKKTKDKRRADFAIYINSDIIIPIEVEQYTNIQQGEDQLSQYQSDFEKQAKLKDYIDDLVFALYFNISLREVGIDKAEEIQKDCSKSQYYRLL